MGRVSVWLCGSWFANSKLGHNAFTYLIQVPMSSQPQRAHFSFWVFLRRCKLVSKSNKVFSLEEKLLIGVHFIFSAGSQRQHCDQKEQLWSLKCRGRFLRLYDLHPAHPCPRTDNAKVTESVLIFLTAPTQCNRFSDTNDEWMNCTEWGIFVLIYSRMLLVVTLHPWVSEVGLIFNAGRLFVLFGY